MFVSTHIHAHTQPHAHTPTHAHTHIALSLSLSLSHSPTLAHSLPFHQMHTCAKTIKLPSPQTLTRKHTHTLSLSCAHTHPHKHTHTHEPHTHTSAHAPQQHIHHLIIVKIPKRLKNEKKNFIATNFLKFHFSFNSTIFFLFASKNRTGAEVNVSVETKTIIFALPTFSPQSR